MENRIPLGARTFQSRRKQSSRQSSKGCSPKPENPKNHTPHSKREIHILTTPSQNNKGKEIERHKKLAERKHQQSPELHSPQTTETRPGSNATSKRLASRYYQLKMGHAITGEHLKRINSTKDNRCWWYNNGDRQTMKHLIKDCHKWRKEREKLKKEINTAIWNDKGTEHIFADRKNTPAILKFLE
jgi:hypothetical protein